LLHTKGAIAALTCLLLAGLGGCGTGGEETAAPRDPARELARWFGSVEAAVARKEEKQRDFTGFQVGPPPQAGGIRALSPAGAEAGKRAEHAVDKLDAATGLSAGQAAGLYCYFFAFYAGLETVPAKKEFEVVIGNLVKTESSLSAPASEVRESADALHQAMTEVEKAGGRAPDVAAAGFC